MITYSCRECRGNPDIAIMQGKEQQRERLTGLISPGSLFLVQCNRTSHPLGILGPPQWEGHYLGNRSSKGTSIAIAVVETLDSIFDPFYPGIHIPIPCFNPKCLPKIFYFFNCDNCCISKRASCSLLEFLPIFGGNTGSFPFSYFQPGYWVSPSYICFKTISMVSNVISLIVIVIGLHCRC